MWQLNGGGPIDPALMLAAAMTARWRFDFPLAERLARAAEDAGAGFPASLLAVELAALQGRPEEAEARLAILAERAEGDTQQALVALARADNFVFALGRSDDCVAVLERAEAVVDDPDLLDEMAARKTGVVLARAGPLAAASAAEPVLQQAGGRGWRGRRSSTPTASAASVGSRMPSPPPNGDTPST